MTRLGRILQSNGRNLVVQVEQTPEIGVKIEVRSSNRNHSGEIVDIFGPTENPYVTIRLDEKLGDDLNSLINKEVFLEE